MKQSNKQGTKMPERTAEMDKMMTDPTMMKDGAPMPRHKLMMPAVKTQAAKPPKK